MQNEATKALLELCINADDEKDPELDILGLRWEADEAHVAFTAGDIEGLKDRIAMIRYLCECIIAML